MSGVARVNRDNAQGIIIGPGSPNVLVNGQPASLVQDRIAPHGKSPHTSSIITSGSSTVFSNGKHLSVSGSVTSCGHSVTPGSSDVKADGV